MNNKQIGFSFPFFGALFSKFFSWVFWLQFAMVPNWWNISCPSKCDDKIIEPNQLAYLLSKPLEASQVQFICDWACMMYMLQNVARMLTAILSRVDMVLLYSSF